MVSSRLKPRTLFILAILTADGSVFRRTRWWLRPLSQHRPDRQPARHRVVPRLAVALRDEGAAGAGRRSQAPLLSSELFGGPGGPSILLRYTCPAFGCGCVREGHCRRALELDSMGG